MPYDNYKSYRRQDINQRKCFNCGSDKTITSFSHGVPWKKWRRINGEWHCDKCYNKIKTTPEQRKRKNANRLKYKGHYVRIKQLPTKRTGRCSWCPNNIFDGSCKQTQFHHVDNQYNDDNPMENAVEVCASCHAKETNRIKKLNMMT